MARCMHHQIAVYMNAFMGTSVYASTNELASSVFVEQGFVFDDEATNLELIKELQC